MADVNASLPIRTQTNGDVVVKVADGTTNTQLLSVDTGGRATVKVSDGTDTLAINADGSLGITDNGGSLTVDAVDLDIRNLSHSQDNIKIGDGVDFLAINADGSIGVTDNGGALTVDAVDLDIRNLVAAQDTVVAHIKDENGTAFSSSNPLPVVVLESEGTEVNDYNTAAAVASAATSNHDYTVTAGKTLQLTQIESSASGKMKIEVQIETGAATGIFNTKFVQFNSASNPNMSLILKEPISVGAGVKVRVIRKNLDLLAQDVYSSVCGHEV